jgi:hypothetical protein
MFPMFLTRSRDDRDMLEKLLACAAVFHVLLDSDRDMIEIY